MYGKAAAGAHLTRLGFRGLPAVGVALPRASAAAARDAGGGASPHVTDKPRPRGAIRAAGAADHASKVEGYVLLMCYVRWCVCPSNISGFDALLLCFLIAPSIATSSATTK